MSADGEARFIGSTVTVDWTQEVGFKRPVAIVVDGTRISIDRVLDRWDDHGFGQAPPKKRAWYLRRHRTCYRVLAEDGRVLELYLDRAAEKETWVLVKEIRPSTAT